MRRSEFAFWTWIVASISAVILLCALYIGYDLIFGQYSWAWLSHAKHDSPASIWSRLFVGIVMFGIIVPFFQGMVLLTWHEEAYLPYRKSRRLAQERRDLAQREELKRLERELGISG